MEDNQENLYMSTPVTSDGLRSGFSRPTIKGKSEETVTTRRIKGLDPFTEKQWLAKRKREKNARRMRKLNRQKQ